MATIDKTAESIKEVLAERAEIRKQHVNPNPTTIEQYDNIRREHDCYPIRHKTRGHALIITMTDNRRGWKEDIRSLEKMFSYLSVDTDYKFNLSSQDTETALRDFAASEKTQCVDVLFTVLMGHGGTRENQTAYETADNKHFILRQELPTIFNNAHYSTLVNLPKIFIAQMCRGVNELQSVTESKTETDASCVTSPLFTDYLLCFATQPETVAYRDLDSGSWYIQILTAEVIKMVKQSNHLDISHILAQVNDKLEKRDSDKPQVSEHIFGLKRPLYLFPGLDMPSELKKTQEGLTPTRKKLAKYFKGSFSTLYLYSCGESMPKMVRIDEVYTHIKWFSYVQSCAARTVPIQLQSYKELFDKLCDTKGTRVIVTGVPGSGKTTFVKYLCYEWAKSVLENNTMQANIECESLNQYLLVLPIKVRLVKNETTVEEILKNQLQLEKEDLKEICRVLQREESATKILFVLDGWDESGLIGALQPLLEKRKYPDTKIILTTRPHGVNNFRRVGKQREDQKAEIWGFTKPQMENYIKRFFDDRYLEEGKPLLSHLESQKGLLSMAKIPLNLEMMCQVWNKKKNLGNKLVDIYEEFVKCPFEHYKKKPEWLEQLKVSPEEKYTEIVQLLGKLATRWDRKGTFHSTFNEEDLQSCLGSNHKMIVDLGYIMSEGDDDRWVFAHATMQDYFAAYHFAHYADDKSIEKLVKSCARYINLDQHKGMIGFLCGLNFSKANSILHDIVTKYENREDCERLLKYILHCLKEYKHLQEQKLPLPKHVEVNPETNVQLLHNLFETDSERGNKNMKHIAFKSFPTGRFPSLTYVKSLEINRCNICSSKELEKGASSLFVMNSLSSVSININICDPCKQERFIIEENLRKHSLPTEQILHSQISMEQEKMHEHVLPPDSILEKYLTGSRLSCKKLEHASFEGKGITKCLPAIIEHINQKSKTLKFVQVVEHDPNILEDTIGKLCETAESNQVSKLHLEMERLLNSFHKLQKVLLFLTVRATTHQDLSSFVKASSKKEPCFMKELALIGVQSVPIQETCTDTDEKSTDALNAEAGTPNSGENLASILYLFPKLEKVKFEQCGITKDTLNAMNKAIVDNHGRFRSPVKELNFVSNDLSEAGHSLGDLIIHTDIEILSVSDSRLGGAELEHFATQIPEYDNLRKLRLENNPIAHEFSKVAHLLKKLPNLEVLEIVGCGVNRQGMQELNDALQDDDDDDYDDDKQEDDNQTKLKKLRVLDLGYNDLSQGGLLELGHFINLSLPELQALSIPYCQCGDVDDLAKLVTRFPKKVDYLDISKNLFRGKIAELSMRRENVTGTLCQLRRLNIGQRDNESERVEIRAHLAEIHKNLGIDGVTEVYYADQEDVCKMYSLCS